MEMLPEMTWLNQIIELISTFGLRILGSIAIVVIGSWGAKQVARPVKTYLQRSRLDDTITNFMGNLVSWGLIVFVVIAALHNLGFETTSFVALIGAMGLAFGLALEGSLANFAAGVLLAVFRPFQIGDFVEVADKEGFVEDISIVTTTIVSLDNEVVIIPNSDITSGTVTNFSARKYVRVEAPLIVGHEESLDRLEPLLIEAVLGCDRVMAEPPPEVQVTKLAAVGVELQVEVTCLAKDREDVVFDMNAAIKRRFDKEGIVMGGSRLIVQMMS